MSWAATPYFFLSFKMPEAKSDEMSGRSSWTIYCQKVATPRIDRPLSTMPISKTPTIVPRIWNRPGLRPGSMTPSHRRSRSTRRRSKPLQAGIAWLQCRPDATPRLCFRWRIGYGRIAYGSGSHNRSRQPAASDTSCRMKCALPSRESINDGSGALTSASMICAPSDENSFAVAAPCPRLPPVMIATLLARRVPLMPLCLPLPNEVDPSFATAFAEPMTKPANL
jgi:hypothetical protein